MILRELYYFDKKTMEPVDDDRFDAKQDQTVANLDDTRKTKLTLKDINRARRADDMHRKETNKDLSHVRAMYAIVAQQPAEPQI